MRTGKARPFRWTRFRKALRILVRIEGEQLVRDRLKDNARHTDWSDSERAMSLAGWYETLDDVIRRMRAAGEEIKP